MKKVVLFAFVLVLLSMSMLGIRLVIPLIASTIHHVYLGDSIQDAINTAQPGDTIFVHNGTYYEHVIVDKSVSLIGENRRNTIIDGNSTGNVIEVTASKVNITGFTVQKSGAYPNGGIYVGQWNSGNNISHNIITNNYYGIRLYSSSGNTVCGNNVSQNQYGIYLDYYSVYNTVCGNNVSNNDYFGIYVVDYSGDNTVSDNTLSSNNRHGIIMVYSSKNVVSGNIISSNDGYGIALDHAHSNTVSGNTFSSNNAYGIYLYSSSSNVVFGNAVSDNYYGIRLESSGNNTLFNNNMTGNRRNFFVYGNDYSDFDNSVDVSNTVDGKPVYYLKGVTDTVYGAKTNAGTFYLINCNNITIKDLTLTKNGQGVFFWNTTSSKIEHITVSNNTYGIWLDYSGDNSVFGNTASNNGYGILLKHSGNNTVSGNNASNNGHGIWIYYYSNNNTVSSNIASSNNDYGIELTSHCDNNVITGNTASNNGGGIRLGYSNSNVVSFNTASSNKRVGIYLECSSNNVVSGNIVCSNKLGGARAGIRLESETEPAAYSSNNTFCDNTAYDNYYGISIFVSSNNVFFHNNFLENTQQVLSYESTNVWDDGYPSGGNYWSDYAGVDIYSGPYQDEAGSDGIGDTPYIIDVWTDSRDRYPFMNPLFEHELAVSIEAPAFLKPGDSSSLRATINNLGSSNETNVELQLIINSTIVNSTTISVLVSGASYTLSYLWTPVVEGIYNVTTYASLVPGETLTANNLDTKFTIVRFPPVHNLNTGLDYQTIQEAIDAPETLGGHTVLVDAETYYEHVVVSKSVSLIGENRSNTIIDGNFAGNVIEVTASNVNITGFTIQKSGYENYGIYVGKWKTGNNISYNVITNNYYGIWLDQQSNGNSVSSNNVSSNDGDGIYLDHSSGNTVSGNIVSSNVHWSGIRLDYSANNVISDNTVSSNYNYGIRLSRSVQNTLSGNNVSNNGIGIYLYASGANTLFNNNMTGNTYNFHVRGETYSEFNNSVDVSNTVDGKPVYYVKGVTDTVYNAQTNAGTFYLINCNNITIKDLTLTKNEHGVFLWNTANSKIENVTVSNNGDGIYLDHSSNNTIIGNNASNNSGGISLYYSSNNIISGNNASSNYYRGITLQYSSNCTVSGSTLSSNGNYGILFSSSDNNTVTGNTLSSNKLDGIRFDGSDGNIISGNNISSNYKCGIELYSSSNNVFFHNNFVDNTEQVYSYNSVNVWDDGYPSGGNYWSEYEDKYPYAEEIDDSGIWDTPYVIDENNQDNYPIVPEFSTWTSMLLILIVLTVAIVIYKRRLLRKPMH